MTVLVPASEPTTVAVASAKKIRSSRGNGVVFGDEPGALGDRDQRADVVKEIDEEEDEDDLQRIHLQRAANVEVKAVSR